VEANILYFEDFEFPLDRPVNFYLVKSATLSVMVDLGTSKSLSKLLASGLKLDMAILTHYHLDHSGGLVALARHNREVRVCASRATIEILYNTKLVEERMLLIAKALGLSALPLPEGAFEFFRNKYVEISEAAKSVGLEEPEDCLSKIGGEYMECPGHSIDHICILFKGHFFIGDNIVGGPNVTLLDVNKYFESMIRALSRRDYEVVHPGHGPPNMSASEASAVFLETFKAKRRRLARVLSSIASKDGWVGLDEVYERVYKSLNDPLKGWVAARSLIGYLNSLEEDGIIEVNRAESPWRVRLKTE